MTPPYWFSSETSYNSHDPSGPQLLTRNVEDSRGPSGFLLADSSQRPLHLHGLGGANGGTGQVEGGVGERGHILRLLDEVRDSCRDDRGRSTRTGRGGGPSRGVQDPHLPL